MMRERKAEVLSYLTSERGIASWLLSRDHKRVALVYLVVSLCFLVLGIGAGILLHIENWSPETLLLDAATYDRVYTLHGVLMMYVVLIPCVYAPFTMFLVPLMLGAQNFVLPRINAAALHLYLVGGIAVLTGCIGGRLDSGFTFYTPYATHAPGAVTVVLCGALAVWTSLILIAINCIVTTHRHWRPLTIRGFVPHIIWALYAVSLAILMATVFASVSIGGSSSSMDTATYPQEVVAAFFEYMPMLAVVPCMGILFELISVHGRISIFRKPWAAASLMISATASTLYQIFPSVAGDPMFGTFAVFTTVSLSVFWLRTLYHGSIQHTVAGWYAAFVLMVMYAGLILDVSAPSPSAFELDTYTVIGHFHYAFGALGLMALLAGIHHWWPKITGREVHETCGKIGAVAIFLGLNITFIGHFCLGYYGMPRRYSAYLPEYQSLHMGAALGAILFACGFVWTVSCLIVSLTSGRRAAMNPWGARTLEWQIASPPATQNFTEPPVELVAPYDFRFVAPNESTLVVEPPGE
jgi:cytochrome c oxidase subunit 1